jgi:hypothetical protein
METHNDVVIELKKLNKSISKLNSRLSPYRSFFSGVMSGLGSVVGATIVVALIAYVLRNVDVVPIIGEWLSGIIAQVLNNLPQE